MDPAVQLALRAAFALLLASAAFHKLRDLARFRAVLASYEILPSAAGGAVAAAVVACEATLAFLLAAGSALPAAGAAAAALMLAYAAAIQVNVRRGRTDLDCGCMGPASRVPLGQPLVVRNLLLALAAAPLVLPATPRPLGWLDLAGAAMATAALAACWMAAERLLALAPRAAALRRRPS